MFSSWTAAGEWIYKPLPLDENLTILPPRFQPIWTQPSEVLYVVQENFGSSNYRIRKKIAVYTLFQRL